MDIQQFIKDVRVIRDPRGALMPFEFQKEVPFEIKRVYFLTDLQSDLARGFHAHKELRQLLVCIKGSCDLLLDDGLTKKNIKVEAGKFGVILDKMIWHVMDNFSSDAVVAVFASAPYDESDYIRNYEEFLAIVGAKNG